MRKRYHKNGQVTEIIYAESLNHLLNQKSFKPFEKNPSILFVSTQPFYEIYYEKFASLLDENQSFQWYICPNNETVNDLKTYQKVLLFIEEMNLPTKTLIVGAGNHHIYHLCGTLKESSFYLETFIYFPTTVRGFSDALNGFSYLTNNAPFSLSTQKYVLPESLIYDTMLSELESKETWITDFFSLIKLGVLFDVSVFNRLIEMKVGEKSTSFSPYLESIIEIQQTETSDSLIYLMAFSKAFYHLTESHYLSLMQKEQISFLLYLYWNLKKQEIVFDFKQFVWWYEQMCYLDLSLPKQMNTYDLAESIIMELDRFPTIIGIEKIGQTKECHKPTLEEMYHVIESYRQIKND